MSQTILEALRKPEDTLKFIWSQSLFLLAKFNRFNKKFRPNVQIHLETKQFILKTATAGSEVRAALRLRQEVFFEEMIHIPPSDKLDMDEFDFDCDHLLVIEKTSGKVVGTYRIRSSIFTRRFYSETEFDLKPLMALPGNKLELGRACIHRDFRRGGPMLLLWKGIAEYARITQSKYLFGCSSLVAEGPSEAYSLFSSCVEKGYVSDTIRICSKGSFQIPRDPDVTPALSLEIPSLLESYLKSGAKIVSEPAFDEHMLTIDFLTVLEYEKLSSKFERTLR